MQSSKWVEFFTCMKWLYLCLIVFNSSVNVICLLGLIILDLKKIFYLVWVLKNFSLWSTSESKISDSFGHVTRNGIVSHIVTIYLYFEEVAEPTYKGSISIHTFQHLSVLAFRKCSHSNRYAVIPHSRSARSSLGLGHSWIVSEDMLTQFLCPFWFGLLFLFYWVIGLLYIFGYY